MSAHPPQVARIGRWIIPAIPFGWTWMPDFGIQRAGENITPGNIYLKEDDLLAGDSLLPYIQTQIAIMKRTFLEPTIAGPAPLEYAGAEEAAMLMLRHQPMNQVSVIQVQYYVRISKWIGIATLTTTATDLLKVRPDFEQFMKLLQIARDHPVQQ